MGAGVCLDHLEGGEELGVVDIGGDSVKLGSSAGLSTPDR
jgi:hypothetical protein